MNKLIHHIHKHKERVVAHIAKHHKKYLFGLGIGAGIGALKILGIFTIVLGMLHFTQASEISVKDDMMDSTINHVIYLMDQIDTMAHTQFAEMKARNIPFPEEQVQEFETIDKGYENATDTIDKFHWAKKLDVYFHNMDLYLHQHGLLTSPEEIIRDKKYHQMDHEVDQFFFEDAAAHLLPIFEGLESLSQKVHKLLWYSSGLNIVISGASPTLFEDLDTRYNAATSIIDKYKAAIELDLLLKERDQQLHEMGFFESHPEYQALDNQFHQLDNAFNDIKTKG